MFGIVQVRLEQSKNRVTLGGLSLERSLLVRERRILYVRRRDVKLREWIGPQMLGRMGRDVLDKLSNGAVGILRL